MELFESSKSVLKRIGIYKLLKPVLTWVWKNPITAICSRISPEKWKEWNELQFWKTIKEKHKERYVNDYYIDYFTKHFGLTSDFYTNKKILDIGCGPLGSLEWADMASERIGLDTLANEYLKLGAIEHKMEYVNAPAEKIPFGTDYFDVVTSFNSLDHVADLDATIAEIKRVLRPGGVFLLLTDVNHKPTSCEPQKMTWDVVRKFRPEFMVVEREHYEKNPKGLRFSLDDGIIYDNLSKTNRSGLLSVIFLKRSWTK